MAKKSNYMPIKLSDVISNPFSNFCKILLWYTVAWWCHVADILGTIDSGYVLSPTRCQAFDLNQLHHKQ